MSEQLSQFIKFWAGKERSSVIETLTRARRQYVPPRAQWNQGSPRIPSPLSLPNRNAGPPSSKSPPPSRSGTYYEDVDPRFAAPSPNPSPRPTPPPPIQTNTAYEEEIPQGSRSPAESERSTFTSISQRGVNPRWNPPPGPPPLIPRRPVNRNDAILNSNPDFELQPGRGSPPRAGGLIPGSAYPTGPI